ncbi:hypothetical protein [Streptococcus lutetiensis]|uniref:hypothetical protein n=1 Tax=Streptococcus lutetiensis TaxID=150055 RepID=UPI001BD94886|nr:hypothetical protein [Streptococcus lutetiensis]MBT0938953.1 hypothetical protein [Streptococcus lutetiensis]
MIIISRKARKLLKSLLDIRKSQESPRIKPEQYEKLIDKQGEPLGELIHHKLVVQDISHDIAVTDEGIYFYQAYKEHNKFIWLTSFWFPLAVAFATTVITLIVNFLFFK